jgi:hypothetical protein
LLVLFRNLDNRRLLAGSGHRNLLDVLKGRRCRAHGAPGQFLEKRHDRHQQRTDEGRADDQVLGK